MRVRLASPSALAEFGPLRAAGQSWNGRLADHNMSLRQYVRAWFDTDRRSELPPDAYCFVDVAASDGLAMRQARLRAAFSETCRQLAANAPSTTPDGSRFRVEDLGRQTRMRLLAGPIGTGTGWHNHGPALAALLEGRKRWYVHNVEKDLQSGRAPLWLRALLLPDASSSATVSENDEQREQAGRSARSVRRDSVASRASRRSARIRAVRHHGRRLRHPHRHPTDARGSSLDGEPASSLPRHEYLNPAAWEARALASGREHPELWREHVWHCTQEAGDLLYLPDSFFHAVLNLGNVLAWTAQTLAGDP